MTYISESLRHSVIERANNRCEYCLMHQDHVLYTHEIDHIIPEKHRGETSFDNLCLACLHCNRHKGADFASFDPETNIITTLYNPREQSWQEHFKLDGAKILPISAEGRVTVFVLKLNDALRLRSRQALLAIGQYPPSLE